MTKSFVSTSLVVIAAFFFSGQTTRIARADLNAAAEIVASATADPTVFHYDITLHDTGTTNIGTFWYSWIPVPSEGFLFSQPLNILNPAGWSHIVTDTYAIEWVNTTTPLTSGNTLTGFSFDSHDTPSEVFGNSINFPGTPVGTSFVYVGGAFATPGLEFVVQPVPEPSTIILFVLGALGLLFAARRRKVSAR